MAVASFVVHPGLAETLLLPLCCIGTANTLIKTRAAKELGWGVFGKIVGQALPVQSHCKATLTHQKPMRGYGFKMLPQLHIDTLLW
jgi:hypothetical protein